jgi:hypothetical protein
LSADARVGRGASPTPDLASACLYRTTSRALLSAARDATLRLVRDGQAMARGGYLALLNTTRSIGEA